VYAYGDPRTYPLSSYSYMIIPTASDDPRMSTAKRQTLADYIKYSICDGQAEIGPIGYSPLPINLVQASFDQLGTLKKADGNVDISQLHVTQCHNPTFDPSAPAKNHLAEIAPLPPICDKVGHGPCLEGEGTFNANPGNGGQVPDNASGGGSSSGGGGGSSQGGGSNGGGKGTTGQDPGAGIDTGALAIIPEPIDIARAQGGTGGLLNIIAVLEFLAILALPPLLVWAKRRRTA